MRGQRGGASAQGSSPDRSPLAGKISDETGDRLTPSHTSKSGRRYRYYVSSRLLTGQATEGEGWRLPARELERAIATCITGWLVHPHTASRMLAGASASSLAASAPKLAALAGAVSHDPRNDTLASLVASVRLAQGLLTIELDPMTLAGQLHLDTACINTGVLKLEAPFTHRQRGVETRLVMADPSARPDPTLIRAVTQAHAWWQALRSGRPMKAIAETENISQRRVALLMTLAFLAPDITEAILEGRQPVSLTLETLIRNPVPHCWNQQREMLLR